MIKLASLALTSLLGVAGIAAAVPALAGPAVIVDVPVPAFFGGPYPYAHGPYFAPYGAPYGGYWHRDFGHDFYRRGWGGDHYHHFYRR